MSVLAKKKPTISVKSGSVKTNQSAADKAAVQQAGVNTAVVKPVKPKWVRAVPQKPKAIVIKTTKPKKTVEAKVEDMNRKELEGEIARLKGTLSAMRARNDIIDPVSGLPKRGRFMEMAGAEFNRTRRYEHDLTLVMATVSGHRRILKTLGQNAADQVMTCVAEMCVSSTRFGVDILGRINDDKIAMLLPETDLQGGQLCLERMRKLVSSMPITIDGERVKVGLNVSARALKDEHSSFVELLVAA